MFFCQVRLEVLIGYLVALLILPIIWQPLLHSIVGQMHIGLSMHQSILKRRSPDKSPLVPIPFKSSIDKGHQHEMPDIELPPLVQKRTLNVLLEDKCFLAAIKVSASLLQNGLYLLESQAYDDTVSPVG